MKVRLAQQLEQAGEWEQAVPIYEELYNSDSMNYVFVYGLQHCYSQLKEYDKAIKILRRWFITHPRDIVLLTALGGLYYDAGNETAADSTWKIVLSADPHNVQTYRVLANELMEHRLYDQCIRTYINGREMCKNETLFADELGTLYGALQQYASAALEYVRLMKNNPDQLPFVISRFNTFFNKPEALPTVSDAVKKEVNKSPDNIGLHRLYVRLLIEEKHYSEALEHYRIIDRLTNANGNELFSFAQLLVQEHAFKDAANVFNEVIDKNSKGNLVPYARFGYARALEEINNETMAREPDSQPGYQDVIQIYESIASGAANKELVIQSLYRIGLIKFEKIFDLNGALAYFCKIPEIPGTSNIRYDAEIKAGEVQTARNDLEKARKEFERAAKTSAANYHDLALFKLAELDYFEAHFDSSLSVLKQFDAKPNTDLANDALQLKYFIEENITSSPAGLADFAKADLEMRQRKYSESLSRFSDIVKHYPDALLLDDAMMKIGELQLKFKHTDDAIEAFGYVTDSIKLSILKDKAQFKIAEIFENILHDKSKAIDAYQKLLERYPNSLYAEESRKRIRVLRGDII